MDNVLADILPKAMDRDCFYLTTAKISETHFHHIDLFVDQTSNSLSPFVNVLPSPAEARAIAVVDRSADIQLAAEAIVTARLSPYNTSPYSPDLIIVYELFAEQFFDAVFEYGAKVCSLANERIAIQAPKAKSEELIRSEKSKGLVQSRYDARSGLTIIQVQDRYILPRLKPRR